MNNVSTPLQSDQQISKEELNNLLMAAQQLEQQSVWYKQQMDILSNYLGDIANAENTLLELKNRQKDNKILIPIGAENFLYAKIDENDKILVSLGAKIHAEKNLDAALEDLKKKKEEVENQLMQRKTSFNKVNDRLREIEQILKSVK